MGESIGCHAAIVLQIEGRQRLADVGLPLFTSLQIEESASTHHESRFHNYTVTPVGSERYDIDRDRHPDANCYTLINKPVLNEQYRGVTVADYGADGHFLDRVIINKVIDNRVWRFNSGERPFALESFIDGGKATYPIGSDIETAAAVVSERFSIDQETVPRDVTLLSVSFCY
jgi:hypothetical protein